MKYECYEIYPGQIITVHFVPKNSKYLVIRKHKRRKIYHNGIYNTTNAKAAFVNDELKGADRVETIRHELLHAFSVWKKLRMSEKQIEALDKINITFPKVGRRK